MVANKKAEHEAPRLAAPVRQGTDLRGKPRRFMVYGYHAFAWKEKR